MIVLRVAQACLFLVIHVATLLSAISYIMASLASFTSVFKTAPVQTGFCESSYNI